MAFPLASLALPLLFTGGSMVANTIAQNKRDNARASALSAERLRQKQFDDEAFALNRRSQDSYADAGVKQGEASSNLAEMFKKVEEDRPSVDLPTAPPESGNVVIGNRNAAAMDEAQAQTDERATNLAEFRSFGDLFGGLGRGQARDAAQIGTLQGFRRGSQGVLPLELEAANQKGQGLQLFADLMGLGSAMTMGPALGGPAMPASGLTRLFGG